MRASAVLTRQARHDLRAAIQYIGTEDLAAARALNDAVLQAARRLGHNPALGARRPALADERFRFWSLPRFSYLLVYTDRVSPPRILRVLHTARDLPRFLTARQP
ncbi:type II toxin-antitoxin system RelE/ParE family toxin [Roseomonas mucosa]|uniref:type II toxin-antitoxin system RelE/ParE family toxin n=1 Tax=Roseomonas mucosa TaxID=207340 RepID=UPI0028CE343C|nr:type II toxin-antitoxin system RelE/ParE family toxin [Roseomonas mucosa]MDT8316312.1 type II toxin-antitoxin system RelE/ParE family toxin [Roseomonas mucosa]MDT8363001.1 type II toxin-antitoxin system RelE/ParE family toxin [Roseomonas mucosa]